MSVFSPNFISNETDTITVSLNISEIRNGSNETIARIAMKRPSNDSSINNIIFGIGLVVVILLLLLIIIKLIYKCYRMYHDDDDDDDKEEQVAQAKPFIPPSPRTAARQSPSLHRSTSSINRSSPKTTNQTDIRLNRLSQTNNASTTVIKES